MPHHGRRVALRAEARRASSPSRRRSSSQQLYAAFVAQGHAPMLEINPLVITKDGKLLVPRRQDRASTTTRSIGIPNVAALRDDTEEDPKEIEASKYDLAYIALDGTIGCMVNGAGLAMATMDIIKLYGGDARRTSSTSAAARRARR